MGRHHHQSVVLKPTRTMVSVSVTCKLVLAIAVIRVASAAQFSFESDYEQKRSLDSVSVSQSNAFLPQTSPSVSVSVSVSVSLPLSPSLSPHPPSLSLSQSPSAATATATTLVAATSTSTASDNREEACHGDAKVGEFSDLLAIAHCRVIYGSLEIIGLNFSHLVHHINLINNQSKSGSRYDRSSYQLQVEELWGYLLVASTAGLGNLGFLLPRLSLIRGDRLWSPSRPIMYPESSVQHVLTLSRPSYSLVIYNTDLTELSLPRLEMIRNGSVFILANDQLCLYTVNWEVLLPNYWSEDQFRLLPRVESNWQSVLLWRNAPKFACLSKQYCPDDCRFGCWNASLCQKDTWTHRAFCRPANEKQFCCHAECLTDCSGQGADQCRFCRSFRRGNFCVSACESNQILLRDECIDRRRCEAKGWLVHDGKCVSSCPPTFCINQTAAMTRECVACTVCKRTHFFLRTLERAAELRHCHVLDGNVTISFECENQALLNDYLGQVRTITGFLLVQNSGLESLEFLSSLSDIGSSVNTDVEADANVLASDVGWTFQIRQNDKLKTLWNVTRHPKLLVRNGSIRFHSNKRLCPDVISDFAAFLGQPIEQDPNEFKHRCKSNYTLSASIVMVAPISIVVQVNDSKPKSKFDVSISNYYYIYCYKQVNPGHVVTIADRDWARVSDGTSTLMRIAGLTSNAEYAIYVERHSLYYGNDYAQTDIIFQRTSTSAPSRPVLIDLSDSVRVSSNSITLRWVPPSEPNGIVARYHIQYQRHPAAAHVSPNRCENRRVASTPAPPVFSEPKSCSLNRSNVTSWFELGRVSLRGSPLFPLVDRMVSFAKKSDANNEKARRDFQERLETLTTRELEILNNMISMDFLRIKGTDNLHTGASSRLPLKNNPQIPAPIFQRKKNSTGKISSKLSPINIKQSERLDRKPDQKQLLQKERLGIVRDSVVAIERTYNSNDTNTITVSADAALVATIVNLTRFTGYEIFIYACQNGSSADTEVCGAPALINAMTSGEPQFDEVDISTIQVGRSSRPGSHIVSWRRPAEPNGAVGSYNLELSDSSTVIALYCVDGNDVNNDGPADQRRGLVHYEFSVNPGLYYLRIQSVSSAGPSRWTSKYEFTVTTQEDDDGLLISLASSCVLTALLLLTALALHLRRKYRDKRVTTSVNPDYMMVRYEADEWELPRQRVHVVRELGQGAFGMVYEGIYQSESGNPIRVALKTSSANSLQERINFLKEASLMKEFTDCHHVVKLLGVISQSPPVTVMMELMENGDLKNFLRRHRVDSPNPINRPPPSCKQRLQIAAQIADGMAYLSAHKFVHRDLAARNCMVHADYTVKIGDFGLARDVYETDYYKPEHSRPLPVRWMPPEAIRDGVFTSKSDVWSFGVVLWEIVTLATQPYAGLANEQVAQSVVGGTMLERPDGCDETCHSLMLQCWQYAPRNRPEFSQILDSLENSVSYGFRSKSWYFTHRPSVVCLQSTSMITASSTASGLATKITQTRSTPTLKPLSRCSTESTIALVRSREPSDHSYDDVHSVRDERLNNEQTGSVPVS